jgi:hypothetical protein
VPEGSACLVSGECAGDSVCDRTACEGMGRCCEGACAPATPKVAVGGDCGAAPCVDDAYCDQSGAGGSGSGGSGGGAPGAASCVARLDNGESCEDSDSCKEGMRCDVGGGDSKCYILSPAGGQCNPNLPVACLALNHWCDDMSSTCATLPGAGSPCTPDGACLAYAFCDNGTCRTRPLENEACIQGGPSCLGDLYCDADVCTRGDDQVCPSPGP